MKIFVASILAALAAAGQASAAEGSADAGKAVFDMKCAMCHASAPGVRSPVAPNLFGVGQRVSGSSDFAGYSPALKKAAVPWNSKSLDQFLTGPNKMVPGTRMVITVPDAQKRADLVAYLVSLKKK
ncbi:c-type cytochrome [uncultured Caulobacter sp.]|uniref:c-type cytochrome n=1 Tax=uncultured Caulobacter sp. TaxID=158749 RepID=UPI002623D105|nr:c-type cytochrome [uncultured Caulobacter sp.]